MDVEQGKDSAALMPKGLKSSESDRGKAPMYGGGPGVVVPPPDVRAKKAIAIFDVFLRLGATVPAFFAAVNMGTNEQQLPFFTQFYQFRAEWDDIRVYRYLVVANAILGGYLILSLPFAIVNVFRPLLVTPRLILIIFDTAMAGMIISAASASASIVYLAHNGNDDANWLPICQQFIDFCQMTSASVIASFIAAVAVMFLIILSALALKRN